MPPSRKPPAPGTPPFASVEARRAFLIFGAVFALGVAGYRLLEGFDWIDALYMTVITLSTVGFGETRPLDPVGKLFTILLVLAGVGTLALVAAKSTEALVEGGAYRRRRKLMDHRKRRGHVVVCGFGRMGRAVVEQIEAHGAECVVVEKDPALLEELVAGGLPHVAGDATDDATLVQAGIESAAALATVLPHDADNLFVTLTARSLNRGLTIVARAGSEKSHSKLLSAGANRVFDPYSSGGRFLARQLLRPSVTEFLEIVTAGSGTDLVLEEVAIAASSPLSGVPLKDAPIRREMDVIVVGVRRPDRDLLFNPPPDLAPGAGDVLVVLGRRDNLTRLAALAAGAPGGRP